MKVILDNFRLLLCHLLLTWFCSHNVTDKKTIWKSFGKKKKMEARESSSFLWQHVRKQKNLLTSHAFNVFDLHKHAWEELKHSDGEPCWKSIWNWLLWLLVGVSGTNVKHNRDLDFMLCQALKKTEAVGTKSQYQFTHCLLAQACSDFLLKALAIVF